MSFDEGLVRMLDDWGKTKSVPQHSLKTSTSARLPLAPSYSTADGEQPGHFPFSRGITPRLYHDNLWVMGMYSGYGSPEETKERFRKLINAGQTGLSIALDLPTQVGVDSDDPRAEGEVGKVGVALNTVEDMLVLLDGLPLDRVQQMRTTANAISPIMSAFTIVALEELGIDASSFRLFLQNDPLKEFSARGTWIFPPAESLRFSVDVIEYFARHHPTWQPIQFCGYHIRDAGGTAIQELAFSAANGIAYLDEAVRRGIDVSSIAPQLFLFLSSGIDLFEEAAKFRAARRFWAHLLATRYGVPEDKAAIKIFAYTLGGALVAQEPMNNVARIAYEALAAVLGGVQTLATSSWDEAHSLPTEEAAHLSLRTQQILAHEAGVTKVVDPLGGSAYVETLTDLLFAHTADYVARLTREGGAVACISSGLATDELAEAAHADFMDISEKRRLIVGVNFMPTNEKPPETPPFVPPEGAAESAIRRLRSVRAKRDPERHARALHQLAESARGTENTIPALIEAARARASIGEMADTLSKVWGRYRPGVEKGGASG